MGRVQLPRHTVARSDVAHVHILWLMAVQQHTTCRGVHTLGRALIHRQSSPARNLRISLTSGLTRFQPFCVFAKRPKINLSTRCLPHRVWPPKQVGTPCEQCASGRYLRIISTFLSVNQHPPPTNHLTQGKLPPAHQSILLAPAASPGPADLIR